MNKFRKRFKELRLSKMLTQTFLAKEFGFGSSTITEWETKGAEPSFDTLVMVADYFDVSTDYLLGRKDFE